MNEIDAIRQRKMEELQRQAFQEQDQRAEMQQQVAQLEAMVKSLFTKEALSRYGNIKAAHPEKAVQLLVLIGQLLQKGNAKRITDSELKKMLVMIQPKTKQIKITRK